jgi:exonuclease VII large subunit
MLRVESLETEEYLIFSCIDREGNQIEQEICEKLFDLPASEGEEVSVPSSIQNVLSRINEHQEEAILHAIMERAAQYLDSELEKLDKWSRDLKIKLESEIENIGIEINQLQREARLTKQLAEKLELNRKVKELEKKRNDMRRNLYDEQDEIDRQKDVLFTKVEEKLQQKVTRKHLYRIHWRII